MNRAHFLRILSGALVHDFFNLFAAGLMFPAEELTRIIRGKGFPERPGQGAAALPVANKGLEFDLIDRLVGPVIEPGKEIIGNPDNI